MIHACRLSFLALVLAVLSPLSHADSNPVVALANLHSAQMSVHATASAFHRFQESEGDNKELVKLNAALAALKSAFQASYQDLADLGLNAELEQLKGHWRGAARDLNSAMTAIAGNGFAEGQVINSYLLNSFHSASDLHTAYRAVIAKTGVKVSPTLQGLRDAATLFQEMAALYMERSSTQYGYTYRSEAGNDEALDQMATRFSTQLTQLQQALAASPDTAKRIANVRSKWGFLEKSFVNYNENAVPYLVEKFGGEIIGELEALAAQYDKR